MTELRAPRLQLLADGVALPGAIAARVTSNNHYAADCFSVHLALSAEPAGLAAWNARSDTMIEVRVALSAFGAWTSLITGRADSIEADPITGLLVVEGRDLTAGLIEARTREAFANQTSSDIVTLLAERHGLTTIATRTTTPVGRYYSGGHERLTLDRYSRAGTEWDLLVWLAQLEGFDLYVAGTTLYFQPAAYDVAPALLLRATPAPGLPANVLRLRLQRAFTLSGDIGVTIKSWNSQLQTACVQTAQRTGDAGSIPRSYIYTRPNLTPDEALQLAQRKLGALTSHEYQLTATMPGELVLTPRDRVALVATSSGFDQAYAIDEISRAIDPQRGFTQTVRARTASGLVESS